jgi:hypothetical protein
MTPHHISRAHLPNIWHRVVKVGRGLMETFRAAPSGPKLSRRAFRASCAPVTTRTNRKLHCASGLEGLAQIVEAMPRKTTGSELALQPFESHRPVQGLGNELPELSGVWFSRGGLHGKVDLSSQPKRGWFEVFATEAA